ncbi:MAG: beta-N-acetylhexosaminidase [Ginsengibacter sp.]
MRLNTKFALSLISGFFLLTTSSAQIYCPAIPLPSKAEFQNGTFLLNQYTPILISNESLQPVAHYLQEELLRNYDIPLVLQAASVRPYIKLNLIKAGAEEAYSLQMNSKGITISASSETGAFYGVISVLQILSQGKISNGSVSISCWNITDEPKYRWRGFMLDESRYFFGKEKVKSILDWMAFYKLNRFHWHLTDAPGWRIEIKKYPLLALIGGIGNQADPFAPAKYYTQEDIKEMVSYAKERHIIIIPEIDMPGHATAANRAYPEFSGGGSEKHPEFTFNPGYEKTYSYLTNILRETNALFPGGMLHLGGDEVSFGNEKWLSNDNIKHLMKVNGLESAKEVEKYFIERMADSVYQLNASLLAWDEVADLNLAADKTIIFWWRQDKPEQLKKALQKKYEVVLCPRLPFYFDFVQDSSHTLGRKWDGKFSSLRDVYDFKASDLPEIQPQNTKQVLGIQANLWTETISNEQRLDTMLFPRIAALAEAAWTMDDKKNFAVFKQRLVSHFALYEKAGILYYKPF